MVSVVAYRLRRVQAFIYDQTESTASADSMAPRLTESIKREVELDGQLYTLTLGPKGVHIAPKGKRKGHELSWRDLASGDAELNRDLIRSLTKKTTPGDTSRR